ncbi:MAG TPA: hypothetical protein VKA37_03135 [Halobacteriales archaeon]|nr:hypothetical protein [Halobacteriales archaeon]
MAENTVVFTFLSGLVLLAIVAIVLRLRTWRRGEEELRGTSTGLRRPSSADQAVAEAIRSPTTWTVGFLLLVLVAVAGAMAMVGALPVPESVQPLVGTVLLILSAAVFGGFVFAGVYASVRSRGYGSAPAVGLGSLAVGLIAMTVVVVRLFFGV